MGTVTVWGHGFPELSDGDSGAMPLLLSPLQSSARVRAHREPSEGGQPRVNVGTGIKIELKLKL